MHFSELPTIFEHLRLATFVALFESEPNARPVLAILFERLCRDLNAGTLKVLDELFDLLATFDAHAEDRRNIVLDMAVMVMVGLSKDKKQRSHLERFRDRVADIIRAEVAGKRSLNELIRMTLPAFVIIVKSHISNAKAAEPSGDKTEVTELIKTFLGHTVRIACCHHSPRAERFRIKGVSLSRTIALQMTPISTNLLLGRLHKR